MKLSGSDQDNSQIWDHSKPQSSLPVVIGGAGPAGLTAAILLQDNGIKPIVLESDDIVGGISRTVLRDQWRFDIGGHRFFTKVPEVEAFWHRILPDPEEFLLRPRLSRIFYNGKYYMYPLVITQALRNLGIKESFLCLMSLLKVRIIRPKDLSNYEQWVASRFGWRLYKTFFKSYTEKVWGMPASEIQADWAAQRIKNLSITSAVMHALTVTINKLWFTRKLKQLFGNSDSSQQKVTSLIEEFHYPKLGPGMMWERASEIVKKNGGEVRLETRLSEINHANGVANQISYLDITGQRSSVEVSGVISSIPLSELIMIMNPLPPEDVQKAAKGLKYRDYLTVALVVPWDAGFPDNWIYIHDDEVKVGRVQNYGSWSKDMVTPGTTCLGMEYFVFEHDEFWEMADNELIVFATQEIEKLGLVKKGSVERGYVVRVPKAYPTYDETYSTNVSMIRNWLEDNVKNVFAVGRNGMHRYNNQDHSMYTAMLSVENLLGASHDIWSVNVEEEYHEEVKSFDGSSGTGRSAPLKIPS